MYSEKKEFTYEVEKIKKEIGLTIEQEPSFIVTSQLMFWGYLHISGTLHLKRYFNKRDIEEAKESPFAQAIVQPFFASSQEEAMSILKLHLTATTKLIIG